MMKRGLEIKTSASNTSMMQIYQLHITSRKHAVQFSQLPVVD